jgi:hypothetical protein
VTTLWSFFLFRVCCGLLLLLLLLPLPLPLLPPPPPLLLDSVILTRILSGCRVATDVHLCSCGTGLRIYMCVIINLRLRINSESGICPSYQFVPCKYRESGGKRVVTIKSEILYENINDHIIVHSIILCSYTLPILDGEIGHT